MRLAGHGRAVAGSGDFHGEIISGFFPQWRCSDRSEANPRLWSSIVTRVPPAGRTPMKNFWAVGILFLLWFLSIYFYMPLPLVVTLFPPPVSGSTVPICT